MVLASWSLVNALTRYVTAAARSTRRDATWNSPSNMQGDRLSMLARDIDELLSRVSLDTYWGVKLES